MVSQARAIILHARHAPFAISEPPVDVLTDGLDTPFHLRGVGPRLVRPLGSLRQGGGSIGLGDGRVESDVRRALFAPY